MTKSMEINMLSESKIEDEKLIVCRVCIGLVGKNFYDIFGKYEGILTPDSSLGNLTIADRLKACANVNIYQNDGLPNAICSSCLLELEDAYNFRKKCEKSDELLRNKSSVTHTTEQEQLPVYFEAEASVKEEKKIDWGEKYTQNIENDDKYKRNCKSPCTQSLISKAEAKLCSINDSDDLFDDVGTDLIESDIKNERLESHTHNQPKKNPDVEKSTEILGKHVISKAKDLKLQCNECGKLFKSKCKIRVHIKREHNTFTCPCCKLLFKSWPAYSKHQKVRTKTCLSFEKFRVEGEGKSQVYYCKECNYSTKSRQRVAGHVVVHTRIQNYKCNICERTFLRYIALKEHEERAHKKLSERQKICHQCGKVFQGRVAYSYHMRKHRETAKQLQCDICKKFFKSKGTIKVHMETHNNKSYVCNKCPAIFKTSACLTVHKYIHSEIFYTCKICGYKTNMKCKLTVHEEKHKPNTVCCTVCKRIFNCEQDLAKHMISHGEKHVCNVCNKSYCLRKCLTEHLRKAHNIYVSSNHFDSFKIKRNFVKNS